MHRRTHLLILTLACAAFLASAPAAFAHAQLLGSSPASGAIVRQAPSKVVFKFNEPVGGVPGAVRVYDARGKQVDDLDVSHPGGRQRWLGVGLARGLANGVYTATYRVVSADTHIVSGGLVFTVGEGGSAPKYTVAGLIERERSGTVTNVAFGVVRALDYLTLALMLGGIAFLLLAWRGGFEVVASEEPQWQSASRALAKRMRTLLAVAIVLGATVSVLGVLLQGASAAGVSLWASLKASIIESTLEGRFGTVWTLRAFDWLALGALLVLGARLRRERIPPRPLIVPIGCGLAYLAITPALSGHASVQNPIGLFIPTEILHVLSASVWAGGIACLLLVLPAATRELQGPQRSQLLFAVLTRFSPLALSALLALAATGAVQAYIEVRSLNGLLHSTYGALIITKVVMLLALIGFGWINRARVIPALKRIASDERAPGGAGVLARRSLRGELVLVLSVFGVTAALISYTPPIDAASGPFAANARIGPAELEVTVEPAIAGLNVAHVYLIDARTGAQFTATKELTVTASLPSKGVGPLQLKASPAGPGHYVLSAATLSPGGTWQIQITDRVSEFDEYSHTVEVPIR